MWGNLRVADTTAIFGVFCRRFGVPLIGDDAIRLPHWIGQSRTLDMILIGREARAAEAHQWGRVNRLVAIAQFETETMRLTQQIAGFPQLRWRHDRRSSYEPWPWREADAIRKEFALGMQSLPSGESVAGARRFLSGEGRHGKSPSWVVFLATNKKAASSTRPS
ncbi:MAG: enoyl-CoA hydratase-related protein [Solimonas sp.]